MSNSVGDLIRVIRNHRGKIFVQAEGPYWPVHLEIAKDVLIEHLVSEMFGEASPAPWRVGETITGLPSDLENLYLVSLSSAEWVEIKDELQERLDKLRDRNNG